METAEEKIIRNAMETNRKIIELYDQKMQFELNFMTTYYPLGKRIKSKENNNIYNVSNYIKSYTNHCYNLLLRNENAEDKLPLIINCFDAMFQFDSV